jgi:hypothetical protein
MDRLVADRPGRQNVWHHDDLEVKHLGISQRKVWTDVGCGAANQQRVNCTAAQGAMADFG